MLNYLRLLEDIMENGFDQGNRTPQATRKLPYGSTLVYDLTFGFPVVTTKWLNFDACKGEYIGFLRGYNRAQDFAALGCNWWHKDANLNKDWLNSEHRIGEGDMGRVYGVQWRLWSTQDGWIDQVQTALDQIRNNPTSRRIIIAGWNPAELNEMCLPPCHMTYHFDVNVAEGELNLCMHQRSCDMFLGVPMNIAGSALMLHLFAKATGLRPRYLSMHLDDTHIYHNHFNQVREQIQRQPYALPSLHIDKVLFGADADELASINPSQIWLDGYRHHPPIKGEMSTTT